MSYDRSVSASDHAMELETVWHLQMAEIWFGRNAVSELGFQFRDLGVAEGAHGLVITDENLVDLGHAARVTNELDEAGFETDVYDGVEREPSIAAIDGCLSAVRDEQGEEG